MSTITDELYESFKKNLESVNGSCMRTAKAGLGKLIADVFTTQEITSISVFESPMMKEAGVVATDKGGVSEAQHGIAELGTIVQEQDDADGRMVSTMSEFYIGLVKGSTIVATYDDMFDILSAMPEIPNFVGFVTGPSRTADIECVATVGVHGPIQVCIIIVDDA